MKKRIFALLVAMLMLVSVFAFAACGDPCADNGHVDADGNEKCDNCDADVPKPDDGGNKDPLPEEPEHEPVYTISYYYFGDVYMDTTETEGGKLKVDALGRVLQVLHEDTEVLINTQDVLQSAPSLSAEQIAEKDTFKYGGITVLGWYTDSSLSTKYDFTQPLSADVKVYAKVQDTSKYAGDEIEWSVTKKGVLKLDGEGPMYEFASPELVPWYFDEDGKRIQITGLEIDKKITSIGSYAFYNLALSSADDIEMSEGVTSIGQYAFAYCENLKEAPLFLNKKVDGEKVKVPGSVKSIARSAFEGCKKISRLVIPDTVENMEDYAFYNCDAVTELILGNGVVTMGDYVFEQSKSGTLNRIYYTGTEEQYLAIDSGLGNDLFLPNGAYVYFYVESDDGVAGPTWSYDSKGYPVYHSHTIRYYSQSPHPGIYPLLVDYIHKSVAKFEAGNVEKKDGIVYRGYKFESWGSVSVDYFSGKSTVAGDINLIGERGTLIGDSASYKLEGTTLKLLGSGSTWNFAGIGDTMYASQTIKSIDFGNIENIGGYALSGITSLVSIEIPDTVKSVDPTAFAGCINLAAIYVIGDEKIEGLDALVNVNASVYYEAKGDDAAEGSFWKTVGNNRFAWSYANGVLTVGGADAMPDFEKGSDAPWAAYDDAKELVIASNVKKVGAYAFADLEKLEKVTISVDCLEIPRNAFEGGGYWNNAASWSGAALLCNDGKTLLTVDASKAEDGLVIIPVSVRYICSGAFDGCSGITAIEVPNVVDEVHETAFAGLTGLKTVYYGGKTIHNWNKIPNTPSLEGVTILYFSYTKPTSNFSEQWHRVDGKPTVWVE